MPPALYVVHHPHRAANARATLAFLLSTVHGAPVRVDVGRHLPTLQIRRAWCLVRRARGDAVVTDAGRVAELLRAARVERRNYIAGAHVSALAPGAYLLCCRPTLLPIACRDGDLVGLWPRHPAHSYVRLDADGHYLGHACLPTDDLFALARHLVLDGTLRPLTAECAAVLHRGSRVAWPEDTDATAR
ncbi:MAG: hypothetical protein MUF00_16805 [Gemmatimonadaceae bacterium]|jgi:hypothetical protein|nr:hypothetical protein [Gemmatimonadaceae bacterium]